MTEEAFKTESLTTHDYDGIKEYDNPCPGWWSWLFFGTFVFSIVYFIFFGWSRLAWTNTSAYQATANAEVARQFSTIGDLSPNQDTLLRFMDDPKWMAFAESVFQAQCKLCHGANGEGQVGPNLTDDNYKNVKSIEDIARVVANGAANGAMPAWKTRLQPNEIVLVSAYAASLRGKNVPGPRGPEGEKIAPWPTAADAATQPENESATEPASQPEAQPTED